MTEIVETYALAFVLAFARLGSCLMVAPGFAVSRVPMYVRLHIALGLTVALLPLVEPFVRASATPDLSVLLPAIASESLIGLLIGISARIFLWALHFFSNAIAMFMGLSGAMSPPVVDDEFGSTLSSLVSVVAVALVFATEAHWLLVTALLDTYTVYPAKGVFLTGQHLSMVTETFARAFLLGLQIASPFILYSVIVNLAFGLVNKLIPQIAIYFISMPFVLAGGLILLWLAIGEFMRVFIREYAQWLVAG